MPNNAEVAAALAPVHDWRIAYPWVEAKARAILDPWLGFMTTTELANRIYDPEQAHDPKVRKRVFQALKALETHGLATYLTMGEPERVGGVENGRRRLWHAPRIGTTPLVQCCPTCKRPL